MRIFYGVLSVIMLAFSLPAFAQDAATADSTAEAPLKISGAVDAYYMGGRAPLPTSFTNGANNSFSLGMANLILSKDNGKIGFCADIAFGPRAEGANGGFDADGNITTLTLIKQLYVTYAPTDALKFTLGNFSTFYGYELIDAPLNVNYSTSYLFSYGPFFHTGIKANLALSDKFGVMVGVFGDTDTKIDVVKGKHIGGQLSYVNGKLSTYLNYLGGRFLEASSENSEIFSNQFDLTASFQATEKFGLGINAARRILSAGDNDEDAAWGGAALYAKYAFSDSFLFGLRAETISDKDGFLFGEEDNNIFALTASGNISIGGSLKLIPELRLDNAKANIYTGYNGDSLKANSVFLVAAVYSF
jgi:Putative beta-barrel porin-2, OmpL-like. bbp2